MVEQSGAHLQLGDLAIEGTGHDTFAQQLEVAHPALHKAAAVVAAPGRPDAAPRALDRAHRFVPGQRAADVADCCNWSGADKCVVLPKLIVVDRLLAQLVSCVASQPASQGDDKPGRHQLGERRMYPRLSGASVIKRQRLWYGGRLFFLWLISAWIARAGPNQTV